MNHVYTLTMISLIAFGAAVAVEAALRKIISPRALWWLRTLALIPAATCGAAMIALGAAEMLG